MDEEARLALVAQANRQHAQAEIKRARANAPIGIALIGIGIALASVSWILPLGFLGKLLIAAIGFPFVPGGVAVLVRSRATIARSNRQIRELAPPVARVVAR